MAGRLERDERDIAGPDLVTIGHGSVRELVPAAGRGGDLGAHR